MRKSEAQQLQDSSVKILIGYLLSSFFGGLLFAILAMRAKRRGKTVFWWFLASLIFIGVFGFLSYALFKTDSPTNNPGYYYLGLSSLVANALAFLLLVITLLFVRRP